MKIVRDKLVKKLTSKKGVSFKRKSNARKNETFIVIKNAIDAELLELETFFKRIGLSKKRPRKSTVTFKAALISTRDFKFNRDDANA